MIRFAFALTLVLAATASGATTAPKQRWETCSRRAVCATEDGGKHWRVIFQVPSSVSIDGNQILGHLRWAGMAGVVSIDRSSHLAWDSHSEFWTRDGGKHWWRTDVFDLGLGGTCETLTEHVSCVHEIDFSRGVASDAPVLYFDVTGQVVSGPQVDPFLGTCVLQGWVPRAGLRCSGEWLGSPGRQLCWARRSTPA